MKTLLLGILLIVIIGFGGLVYRNAVEHPAMPIACPLDAQVCPDGTSVTRTGTACTFPICPPPNITLAKLAISFALPAELREAALSDSSGLVNYDLVTNASSTTGTGGSVSIFEYPIAATSTALATIQATAIGGASGAPVSVTSYTSTVLGTHRFTVVSIERFEGVVHTAYYLARATDVLRFDAIDTGVMNWTDPNMKESALPAHAALLKLLATLQGQ
ncbi:hypothetical protein KGM48_03225 [Patescibacteria group bacterium]|nr:hypothetical protein [Patescibacteria group bacterium]